MPRRAHSAFHPCESSTQPSSRNEVILTGCVGDKLILGVLSLGRPSVPWVTHQVLSPIVGYLSPVAGDLSPVAGDLSPVAGDLSPVAGDLSPVAGDLSPVAGDLSPVGRSGEYTGIQITGASKISRFFSDHIDSSLWGARNRP
jgi:hypothetical protein